jgi:hypothetical protein
MTKLVLTQIISFTVQFSLQTRFLFERPYTVLAVDISFH